MQTNEQLKIAAFHSWEKAQQELQHVEQRAALFLEAAKAQDTQWAWDAYNAARADVFKAMADEQAAWDAQR